MKTFKSDEKKYNKKRRRKLNNKKTQNKQIQIQSHKQKITSAQRQRKMKSKRSHLVGKIFTSTTALKDEARKCVHIMTKMAL